MVLARVVSGAAGRGGHDIGVPLRRREVAHGGLAGVAVEDGLVLHLATHGLALLELLALLVVELLACLLVVVRAALGVERTRVVAVANEVPKSNVDRLETGDLGVRILVQDDTVVVQQLEEAEVDIR